MVLYSTNSHWSVSLKVQEGNVKIPSYPSIYENVYKLQKIFLIRVFWLKYIFRIKFKIPILDLMLMPKNSVPFEGLYSNSYILQTSYS